MDALVSIALCTYNGQEFLAKQLDTILAQDYQRIEIIAVDDASVDGTRDILRHYADKDNRVHVYLNERNLGLTLNFERAIHLCQGEFIALADQDDLWERDKISSLMRSAGRHKMVYHNSDFIDGNGERIGQNTMATKHRMYEGESCLPVILANCIHGHAILFDASLKQDLIPLNKGVSHDWAIAFAAFNTGSVKYVDRVLVHYRQHQRSVTDFLERRGNGTIKHQGGLQRLPVTEEWFTYCLNFPHKKEGDVVNYACCLFSQLMKGRKRMRSFLFMLLHFDQLFYTMGTKQRSTLSKINYVRKLCFA